MSFIIDPYRFNRPFIFQVDTTQSGSANDTFILPTDSLFSSVFNYTIYWGDGNSNHITTWNDPNTTHVYSSPGTYTITIYGQCPYLRFGAAGDCNKMTRVVQWGDVVIDSWSSSYYNCSNLVIETTDVPQLKSGAFNAGTAFRGTQFNAANFGDIDVSGWTDATNFLFGVTTFSTANYDNLLNGWAAQSVQSGVNFKAGSAKYTISTSQAARDILTNAPNNWVITDGGGI